jgi:hypothetical protein
MAVMTSGVAEADPHVLWPADLPYRADYADAFSAFTPDAVSCSPEEWTRRTLEGASLPMRLFLRFGWRFGLGFPLARTNAVLGWPVVAESADWIALGQQSWLFGVVLLMRTGAGQITWATRVEYRSPVARAAWSVVGLIHRRFAPRALRRAARRY